MSPLRHGFISTSLLLVLLPHPDAEAASRVKGGEIMTKERFKYGAFEVRLRAAAGSGLITPFFLIRDGTENPGTPWQEMDIEVFGKDGGRTYQTQLMMPGNPRTQHLETGDAGVSLTGSYHTYRMEWTPRRLAFYIDGRLVREERDRRTYRQIMDPNVAAPMSLRISAWAQDDEWSGRLDWRALPSHAFIQYIQVERYEPETSGRGRFKVRWRDEFQRFDTRRWQMLTAPGPLTGLTDFAADNVQTRDGQLVLTVRP